MQKTRADYPKKQRAINRGREYWIKLIAEWENGHENKKAFCDRVGVRSGTFSHWRYILAKENRGQEKPIYSSIIKKQPLTSFMEVKVNSLLSETNMHTDHQLTIVLPTGIKLLLPMKDNVAAIKEIFHLLGVKCNA